MMLRGFPSLSTRRENTTLPSIFFLHFSVGNGPRSRGRSSGAVTSGPTAYTFTGDGFASVDGAGGEGLVCCPMEMPVTNRTNDTVTERFRINLPLTPQNAFIIQLPVCAAGMHSRRLSL